MNREREIIGAFLINKKLDPKDLGLEKNIFKSQSGQLVCGEILKGNTDEVEILHILYKKSKTIGSFMESCKDGLHSRGTDSDRVRDLIRKQKIDHINDEIIKLISNGARKGFYEREEIKKLYEEIASLESENEKKELFITLDQIKSRPVSWLWKNYFPLGRLIIISGDPGNGKTYFTLDITARITRSTIWPDGEKLNQKGAVLYLTLEDKADDTLRPRIDELGGDPSLVTVLRPEAEDFINFAEKGGLNIFENIIKRIANIRLAVIDPILDFSGKTNPNAPEQVRALLSPLSKIAEKYNIAMILISHLNKAQSMSALYRTGGSTGAWLGKSRAAFMIFRDHEEKNKRYFASLKSNLAPQDPERFAFRIVEGKLLYEKVTEEIEIDEYLNPQLRVEVRENNYVCKWLINALRNGEVDSKKIREDAENAGINKDRLYRAMKKLNIITNTKGFGAEKTSIWSLPKKEK